MSAGHSAASGDRIRVNGVDEELAAATIADLLRARELAPDTRGLAVAHNGAVVPRAAWATTTLAAGDAIEIVTAKQGG
jgi:sulfur carrier protein